jgi:hypothetical protein
MLVGILLSRNPQARTMTRRVPVRQFQVKAAWASSEAPSYLNLATLEYSRCHGRANHKKNAAAASTRSYRSMYKTCGKHDRPAVLRPRGCRRGRKLLVALAGTPARKNSAFPRRVSATIAKWNSPAGESPVLDSVHTPRRATFKTAPGLVTSTVRPPRSLAPW